MKQGLQLKFSQQLTLTPQLQQAIRLLQLSTLELDQEIELIMQTNPLLERVEGMEGMGDMDHALAPEEGQEMSSPDTAQGDTDSAPVDLAELTWQEAPGFSSGDEDDTYEIQTPQPALSLREHLLWQIRLGALTGHDQQLVELLIDALDEHGYLTQNLEEILAMLPDDIDVDLTELHIALKHLQHLDPVGVGARTLTECLALQLSALPEGTPNMKLAQAIVAQELPALGTHDYAGIKRRQHCDDAAFRQAYELIMQLNPRPCTAFEPNDTRYIIPDVIVEKIKGAWVVKLNQQAIPRLRVNQMYAEILGRNKDSDHQNLSGQMQEAKWFIKNLAQRFDTILRVSQCIVDRQGLFLEHGEVAMRPLVLREIADVVELHESTVSRTTTQKFIMTPRGIFELKYFFGSHVNTEVGGACSATAIRALIKQMINAENQKKPLSDGQMAEILAQQGIVVARRTIAKYREALQIPPANQRKAL
uniref:RNA polymerase, sigma 54 (Sigma N) factor n=1 Tax=mine drainage metagenome TaxID=410659 RepID=E6QSF6_9ZZZZ